MNSELPKITNDWLAGFFQAEGSIYHNMRYKKHDLRISQEDPDILNRIIDFLGYGAHNDRQYRCSRRENTSNFFSIVYPYLVGEKKVRTGAECIIAGIELPYNIEPITWDFMIGFWEGDGGIYYNTQSSIRYGYINFFQKETDILEAIRDFLGKGSIVKSGLNGYRLQAPDLREEFLPYCRIQRRRDQLEASLEETRMTKNLRKQVLEMLKGQATV